RRGPPAVYDHRAGRCRRRLHRVHAQGLRREVSPGLRDRTRRANGCSRVTDRFGQRLAGAFDAHGQLCVGIDPHGFLLQSWNLPDDASGLREFGLRVVEAAAGRVGVVKPQVAFFERHGSAGYRALEEVLAAARAAGLLVIADAKRGDVGSTVEAYAQAWLTPGHGLEVDALTMNAYPGVASLDAPV